MRDPHLDLVPIPELRPTQMTVGYREVAEKQRRWAELDDDKRAAFLGAHMVPVILGPKGRRFLIDHHHLVRALHEQGCTHVLTTVVQDLSSLKRDSFWVFADNRGWCHPYDQDGQRVSVDKLPKTIAQLIDDPYRSLAGELRRAGGYAKSPTPFSEFMWADFLRRRIKRVALEKDFGAAMRSAIDLARSHHARYLPGWCGATAD